MTDMNNTTQPDRLPYDGNRSDGFALTDAPVWLEHGTGEDENCGPVLGLDFTIRPAAELMVDLTTGDRWNEPDMREGVLDVIERTLDARYTANIPEGYSVEVTLSGDGYMWRREGDEGWPEVYVTVEMYGGLYREGESTDDLIGRVSSACRYWKIVDELWTLFTGQRVVEAALREHLGIPQPCPWCDGTTTMPDETRPCWRCSGTGVDPG